MSSSNLWNLDRTRSRGEREGSPKVEGEDLDHFKRGLGDKGKSLNFKEGGPGLVDTIFAIRFIHDIYNFDLDVKDSINFRRAFSRYLATLT